MEIESSIPVLFRVVEVYGVVVVFTAFYWCVMKVFEQISKTKVLELPASCAVVFVLGCLAVTTGVMTGASRIAAVGDVVPAVLGLFSAFAVFLVSKADSEKFVPLAAMFSFSVMLLVGVTIGSNERAIFLAKARAEYLNPMHLKAVSDLEAAINGYREHKGLGPVSLLHDLEAP